MNNFLKIVLYIIFLSTYTFSQNGNLNHKIQLNTKLGYEVPFKETFKKNYNQKLFVGSAGIPLSISLGAQYNLSNQLSLFFEAGRSNYQLESSEEISLKIYPIVFGINYNFPDGLLGNKKISPYIGTGVNFQLAVFNTIFAQTDDSGNILEILKESKTYSGFGINFNLGIDYQLGNSLILGGIVSINPSNVGDTETGGLGNIGRINFLGKLGVKL